MRQRSYTMLFLLAAILAAGTTGADAQSERPWSVEAFLVGDSVAISDSFTEIMLGVRSTYRFAPRWSAEASLSRFDSTRPSNFELTNLDLSVRYLFRETKKFHFFTFGGANVDHHSFLRRRFDGTSFKESSENVGFHFGLGFEVDLTDRFYLRPELVSRQSEFGSDRFTNLDLAIGFGFRF